MALPAYTVKLLATVGDATPSIGQLDAFSGYLRLRRHPGRTDVLQRGRDLRRRDDPKGDRSRASGSVGRHDTYSNDRDHDQRDEPGHRSRRASPTPTRLAIGAMASGHSCPQVLRRSAGRHAEQVALRQPTEERSNRNPGAATVSDRRASDRAQIEEVGRALIDPAARETAGEQKGTVREEGGLLEIHGPTVRELQRVREHGAAVMCEHHTVRAVLDRLRGGRRQRLRARWVERGSSDPPQIEGVVGRDEPNLARRMRPGAPSAEGADGRSR